MDPQHRLNSHTTLAQRRGIRFTRRRVGPALIPAASEPNPSMPSTERISEEITVEPGKPLLKSFFPGRSRECVLDSVQGLRGTGSEASLRPLGHTPGSCRSRCLVAAPTPAASPRWAPAAESPGSRGTGTHSLRKS